MENLKKLLIILTFLVSTIFVIDNVNAEVLHYDFEQNYCDNNNSNCFSENGTVSYTDDVNYVTNGDYALYLNNPSKTKSPNALYMLIDEVFDSPEYISIEFDWYRASNAVTYSKLFTYWYSSSGSYTQEVKASGTCSWFMSDTCFEPDTINHVKITKDGSTVTVVNTTVSGNTYTATVTKDAFYRFDLGWNNGDDSPFTGYIDNMYIMTSADDTIENVPTISITEDSRTSVTILEKEYITDVTLNIEFSLIDNEKYLYMYKYGINSEWATMTLTQSNNFSKTYSTNDTLYVQVIDRSTHEVISSNTFTVTKINYDFTPYITIDEITSDSCILGEYTICQSLQINSHIADFKKYSFVIINHTQNTTEKYTKEMTVYKTYYTNSTIEVRIIENETNNIFQTVSFTISTIDEETDNLGQYIKQECYFASIGNNYLCNYYFYNYEPDNYQYYYGTSTKNFEELFLETGTESVFDKTIYKLKNGLGILKEISYSENTTVYFRVLNKETGELIHTQTFVISYDKKLEESGKKDLFDIFKNFNNDNKTIKDIIDNIWNSIKTSSIYEYIMLLIVGALIIVVIKAANR